MSDSHPCATCLICGAPALCKAVYRPGDGGKSLGAPAGKTRLIIYHLCCRCAETPQRTAEWAEVIIHSQLGDTSHVPVFTEEAAHE